MCKVDVYLYNETNSDLTDPKEYVDAITFGKHLAVNLSLSTKRSFLLPSTIFDPDTQNIVEKYGMCCYDTKCNLQNHLWLDYLLDDPLLMIV